MAPATLFEPRERLGTLSSGTRPPAAPLSSDHGTCKTLNARFGPWLSGKSLENYKSFPARSDETLHNTKPRWARGRVRIARATRFKAPAAFAVSRPRPTSDLLQAEAQMAQRLPPTQSSSPREDLAHSPSSVQKEAAFLKNVVGRCTGPLRFPSYSQADTLASR